MQWKDPIIEEIHETRWLRQTQFKDDWVARYQDWKLKEKQCVEQGFRLADLPIKRQVKKAV